MEPVYSGHPCDTTSWLLYRGGLFIQWNLYIVVTLGIYIQLVVKQVLGISDHKNKIIAKIFSFYPFFFEVAIHTSIYNGMQYPQPLGGILLFNSPLHITVGDCI